MTDTLTPGPETAPESRPEPTGLRAVAAMSASLLGTYAVTSALGVLFWVVAARQFPLGSVGVAGAAVALMMLLGTLGTCGLGTLLIARLPAVDRGQRRLLVRTALVVAGAGGAVLAVVVPFVAITVAGVSDLRPVAGAPGVAALFAVGTAVMAVSMVLDQAVLTLGSGNLQLERNTVASVVKLVALLGLVALGESGGMAVFLAWTIGVAVTLPLVGWRTRGGLEHDHSTRLVDLSVLRGLGGQAVSHHSLNLALQVPLQLLPLIVLAGVSAEGNGVFSTALQITGAIFALPYAIAIALFATARGSERDTVERMRRTLPLSLGVSALANLVLFPTAGLVLSVFGAEYSAQGVDALRLLALAGLPIVVKDHFVALRRVQGRTTGATMVLAGMTVFELAAAGVGVLVGGLVGLCAFWLGALVVEAVVLAVPLGRAMRSGARPAEPEARAAEDRWIETEPDDDRLPLRLADGAAVVELRDREAERPERRLARLARLVGVGPALLVMTGGLLLIAASVTRARDSGSGSDGLGEALYVAGLVVIFLPAALGVLLPRVASSTRVVLAVGALVVLQLARLVVEPTRFVQHNELIHVAGLRAIEQSGELYRTNPLLPVTSFYPGLQVATDAVHDLTGLPLHASGVAVLLAARLVTALAVLLVVAWVTRSTRIGAAAVIVYACNPQLPVFNATFSYQTLALPLAMLAVHLVLTRRPGSRWALLPAVLATWAVVASHHLTPLLLLAALVGWLLLDLVLHRGRSRAAAPLAVVVVAGVIGFAVTLLNPGNPLLGYLGEIGASSSEAIRGVVDGGGSRQAFRNEAGVQSAPWEKWAILASLALTLVALALSLWRSRRLLPTRNAFVVLLLGIALVFPIIPAGHLTSATAEVGDRSAGFVFVGVAFVVAWWIWQRPMRTRRSALLGLGATVVFVGSVVLGAGSISNQLPGPFRVSDDARSIDADNLAAAEWMSQHLPTDSVVYGDRVGGLLAGAYGDQFVVRHVGTRTDASRLLLDPEFTADDVQVIREADIRYLIADRRNANGLPNQGIYIESGEFGSEDRTAPVPAAALRKFSTVAGVDVLYDNGSVVVYDLGALR